MQENRTKDDMEITVFGKAACARCRTAKNKITFLLEKHGKTGEIPMVYHDLETAEGMAEGAFNDVTVIPTIIVSEDEQQLRRWDGEVPKTEELEELVLGE